MGISKLGSAARAAYYAERREHVNPWDSVAEAVIAAYIAGEVAGAAIDTPTGKKLLSPGDTVFFPTPSASWGTITHGVVQNPSWRWWAFWRPRSIVLDLSEPSRVSEN